MSGSVNLVILVGNLGHDPEVKTFSNGDRVVNFSLATSERWKKDGEPQERTEWHKVSVRNEHLVSVAERFLRKGSKVCVQGTLQTRKWTDQSGNDRYTTEVVLPKFRGELTLLSGGGAAEGAGAPVEGRGRHWESGSDLGDDIPY